MVSTVALGLTFVQAAMAIKPVQDRCSQYEAEAECKSHEGCWFEPAEDPDGRSFCYDTNTSEPCATGARKGPQICNKATQECAGGGSSSMCCDKGESFACGGDQVRMWTADGICCPKDGVCCRNDVLGNETYCCEKGYMCQNDGNKCLKDPLYDRCREYETEDECKKYEGCGFSPAGGPHGRSFCYDTATREPCATGASRGPETCVMPRYKCAAGNQTADCCDTSWSSHYSIPCGGDEVAYGQCCPEDGVCCKGHGQTYCCEKGHMCQIDGKPNECIKASTVV